MSRTVECPACLGYGHTVAEGELAGDDDDGLVDCEQCGGSGEVDADEVDDAGDDVEREACGRCGGEGEVEDEQGEFVECPECFGVGLF